MDEVSWPPGLAPLWPSSLLTTWWVTDNLITPHPGQLCTGAVDQLVTERSLGLVLDRLRQRWGPVQPTSLHEGTLTWELFVRRDTKVLRVSIPRALDQEDPQGRSRARLPQRAAAHAGHFHDLGLQRYVARQDLVDLGGGLIAGCQEEPTPPFYPLSFGRGHLQVSIRQHGQTRVAPLSQQLSAQLLTEWVALLAYHYDPDLAGGTTIADLSFNDGDVRVRRHPDGSFQLELGCIRRLQGTLPPTSFVAQLLHLCAYEPLPIGTDTLSLPLLLSNPSIAFCGLAQGRQAHFLDRGQDPAVGREQTVEWLRSFAQLATCHAYEPWIEQVLNNKLKPIFGQDPREGRWSLAALRQHLHCLRLQRDFGSADAARSVSEGLEDCQRILARRARNAGEQSAIQPHDLNSITQAHLAEILSEGEEPLSEDDPGASLRDALSRHWPYSSLADVERRVPAISQLPRWRERFRVDGVCAKADLATPAAFDCVPWRKAPRRMATGEIFNRTDIVGQASAVATFPSFESYMDLALHHPSFGYYGHRVQIGQGGDFVTHPQSLSPDYGKWLAAHATSARQALLEEGRLEETDPFVLVEFGAGTGRLACDILAALETGTQEETAEQAAQRKGLLRRLDYRIYELSPGLRQQQRELLGDRATVLEGDARSPERCLLRDFPEGLRGLVITNEVPDAMGVHKVLLLPHAEPLVALVLPQVDEAGLAELDLDLARAIQEAQSTLQSQFGLARIPNRLWLSGALFEAVMASTSSSSADQEERLRSRLRFCEAYVPAPHFPRICLQLRALRAEYARTLEQENTGLIAYVNASACAFVRGIATCLRSGFVLTIDYGGSVSELLETLSEGRLQLRTYGPPQNELGTRFGNPYALVGLQDLTADVNFTDLAEAARDAGLRVLYYGPETALAGRFLADVLADEERYSPLLDEYGFKVLVLGTHESRFFAHARPLAQELETRSTALRFGEPLAD